GHVIGDGERSRTNRRQHIASGRSGQTSDAMSAGWAAPTYAISLCAHRLRQWPRPGSQRDLKMVVPTHLPGGLSVESEVRHGVEGRRVSPARDDFRTGCGDAWTRAIEDVARGVESGVQRVADEAGEAPRLAAQCRGRPRERLAAKRRRRRLVVRG